MDLLLPYYRAIAGSSLLLKLFDKVVLLLFVSPIVVRALIVVYDDQYAWVKWGGSRSSMFTIINGTRQGSVLSPALSAVYVDDLLQELRNLGVGC